MLTDARTLLRTYTESTIDETKASFDKAVSSVRCISTSGARWFLPFWYAREPTFWLPYGWFPYYAEWLISFPAAPLGSVSVASWQLASTAIISIVVNSMGAIFRLVVHARQRTNSRQEAAVEKRRSSLCIEDEGVQESRKNLWDDKSYEPGWDIGYGNYKLRICSIVIYITYAIRGCLSTIWRKVHIAKWLELCNIKWDNSWKSTSACSGQHFDSSNHWKKVAKASKVPMLSPKGDFIAGRDKMANLSCTYHANMLSPVKRYRVKGEG